MDHRPLATVTLILPYYRNPHMLRRQLEEVTRYPAPVHTVIVDDGSPDPALEIVREYARKGMSGEALPLVGVSLTGVYRIKQDVPWNRGGARNLGARVAQTDWIIQADIDHVLPADVVQDLLAFAPPDDKHAYRFPRYRVGAADDTRKKDKIKNGLDDSEKFGRIHPHVDSYLISRKRYWKVGGYDEDFSGHLGGGNEFLRRLERKTGKIKMLPDPICLHVHTRDSVPDASDLHLSRDPEPGRKIWADKQRRGQIDGPKDWLRFDWERVL